MDSDQPRDRIAESAEGGERVERLDMLQGRSSATDRWHNALTEIYSTIGPPDHSRDSPTGTATIDVTADAPREGDQPREPSEAGEHGRLEFEKGRAVDAVCAHLEISDPEKREAVGQAYEVTREYTAPFVTKVADDMLDDIRVDLDRNPDMRVAFVGRDGHSLAMAARRLEPELVREHASEVVLSRAVVEAAVQDLEHNAGREFPGITDFRAAGRKVDPETVDGAKLRLTEYLQTADLPVGRSGSEVTLVDTSYKGTVQELLTAVYPQTSFQGRYVFFGASPEDQHPDAKTGYAVHLDAGDSSGGRPVSELPADRRRLLSHQDAIGAIEETLHGPWTSPRQLGPDGPAQGLKRHDIQPLDGLNPVKVAEPYKDPVVREAVKDVNLLAVADYADQIAGQKAAGVDIRSELGAGFDRYVDQVRAWIAGEDCDPRFAHVMDSFVRRADKAQVNALADSIDRAGLVGEQATSIWSAYDECASLDERAAYVAQFEREHQTSEERPG